MLRRMLLELRNVGVAIGSRTILSNINMKVDSRELHVLIGPNGSGKTSLLNAIMGIKPYEVVNGQVIFMDVDVTREPPHLKARRGIAIAHQLPPVLKGIVAGKFADELVRRYGVMKIYVDTLLETLDVRYLLDRYLFDKMSGGERKRLEMFLTLLVRPKVALLDEPDSGVDIDSVEKMSNAIKVALNSGGSVVLVTHSLHMIKLLRDHIKFVHVLYGGTIIHSGLYDEVVPTIEKHGLSGALSRLVGGTH
ncbi:MAG: ATP-binding cassette domain-containing protein [Sulfolobales archaeon]